jgi:hypothetical protein
VASDVNASFGNSLTLGSGQTLIVDNWEWLYGEGAYISQNTGSSNTCQGLYLGPTAGSGSVADYFQDGGSLTSTVTPEYVGYAFSGGPGGIGYFYQYGGTNNTPELDVGYSNTGVIGEYDLYAGASLSVSGNEYLGVYSQGTFNQNGGTHTISANLYLGGNISGAVGSSISTAAPSTPPTSMSEAPAARALLPSAMARWPSVERSNCQHRGSYVFQAGGSVTTGNTNNGTYYEAGGTANLGLSAALAH